VRVNDQSQPRPEKEGGRVVWLVVLGLGLLFGGTYVAASLLAGDKIARGTTVAGVDVGGQTADEAADTLRTELEGQAAEPIPVTVSGSETTVDPGQVGMSVDYQASAEAADGSTSWSPGRLWDYYTGGDDLPAVVVVDDDAMTATLDELTAEFGEPARDGSVGFRGAEVKVRQPADGRGVDVEAGSAALQEGFPAEDREPVELPVVPLEPDIDADEVRAAVDDFANPAVSGSVTLVFGRSPVALRPEEFTSALRVDPVDGELVPRVDEKKLSGLVGEAVTQGSPEDATVALVDGRPTVIPAKPGVTYRDADVSDAFLDLVTRPSGERRIRVGSTVAEPDFTTADARRLKIKERVSTFTTYYPYAEYRNVNIGRAAELIDGTVLKPGEVFSLNDTVGERTRENGFTEGFIISNGIFKEDLGGGVSQMATTTFNAMFFAGLEDVEHKPHSFYIDRYPAGREATVAWGSVDLRFRNDTPYGVLIQAQVTPSTPSTSGVVTVSMWSTDYWDITTKTGDRYNLTSPATRTLTTADCYPNTGYGGFDIDVWRYFRRSGQSELVDTEKMHTHYIPSDTVICKPPKSP
jgi:vancomycin resistance protein YoaR